MPLAISIVGTLELALIAFLSILAVRDLVLYFVIDHKLGIEWYPLAISLYFVIILTQNLITQYRLEFSNAAISIIYLAAALTWIIFGFAKRYVFHYRPCFPDPRLQNSILFCVRHNTPCNIFCISVFQQKIRKYMRGNA